MTPDEARTQIEKLRPSVSSGKSALVSKFKSRIAAVENLKLVGVIGGVAGALIAAISRAVEGNLGTAMAIGGAVMAAVCGIFIGLMDRRKLEISQEASEAHESADQALDLAATLAEQLDATQIAVEAFDRKRRERLVAIQRMVEVIEASLLTGSGNVVRTAEALLRNSIQSIRAAVEYKGGDFFTVTIFRRTGDPGKEELTRIAAEWTDPNLAMKGGRSWKIGRGYTGVAWLNAVNNVEGDVIVGDTSDHSNAKQYPVDQSNPEREALYRSVAAIPILINRGNDVWGVVTATTDRPGVFIRDKENIKIQNVEMIRDIARVAALLAGIEPKPKQRRWLPRLKKSDSLPK